MPTRVLLLADDERIVNLFRSAEPEVCAVSSIPAAVARLHEPWSVVAALYPLTRGDSIAWLKESQDHCPHAGRLLVCASPPSVETVLRAVNVAQVSHVLVAPQSPEQVRLAVLQTQAAAEKARAAALIPFAEGLTELTDTDNATRAGHALRVQHYAWAIGQAMQLPDHLLAALRLACLLHDLGKVAAPDDESQQHPLYGAYWALRCGLAKEVQEAIRYHHERWDGTGVPEGLKGSDIPLLARLIAMADAYDRWTTELKLPPAQLHAQLHGSAGKAMDPQIVQALFALREPHDVFAVLEQRDDLPVLAPVVQQALELLMRDDFDWRQVAEVLSRDERLAAHLLRLANSAITGFRRRITNLPTALRVLGARPVCNLLLTLSVRPLLRVSAEYDLWRHSLGCALLARAIAQRTRQVEPDEAFAAGLLHDIGKNLLWRYFPEGSRRAHEITQRQRCPLFLAERLIFGTTHAEVGGWLLERWRLPSPLPEAVATHHDPPPDAAPLVWHIYWANALWHQAQGTPTDRHHWCPLPVALAWQKTLSDVSTLVAEADQQVREVERLMGV